MQNERVPVHFIAAWTASKYNNIVRKVYSPALSCMNKLYYDIYFSFGFLLEIFLKFYQDSHLKYRIFNLYTIL